MAPHWNNALGAYVRNRRDFEDGLKRRSDALSERLGTEHRLRPVDHDAVGATDEGLDDTRKAQRAMGLTEARQRTFW
jgi:hypothetical protein